MHPVFEAISMCCKAIFDVLCTAPNVLLKKSAAEPNMLYSISFPRRAVKIHSTEQSHAVRHSTTALLSLIISRCTYRGMYAYAYRNKLGSAFEVLSPRVVGGVA